MILSEYGNPTIQFMVYIKYLVNHSSKYGKSKKY